MAFGERTTPSGKGHVETCTQGRVCVFSSAHTPGPVRFACAGAHRFRSCCATNVSVWECMGGMSVVWRGVCPQWTWVWVWCVHLPSVCIHGSKASPSGSPCDLAQPNTHCPSGCSQTFPGPQSPGNPQRTHAHLHFLCQEPLPPQNPTQAQTRVSRLRSDFISPQISSQPSCWAGPGFPSGTQGPSLLPGAWSLEMSCGCNLELVGRQGVLTAGAGGSHRPQSGAKAAPSASQARLGRGQPRAQVWGDKLGSPAVGRGPQGPAQRRAGPRLSRSPPASAQGLRPACAAPLHRSFSQQSTSTFKIPELMKPIR